MFRVFAKNDVIMGDVIMALDCMLIGQEFRVKRFWDYQSSAFLILFVQNSIHSGEFRITACLDLEFAEDVICFSTA